MPSPRHIRRQFARSVGVPCARRGYQATGTLTVRPSTRSTTRVSSVTDTFCANAARNSLGEILIPRSPECRNPQSTAIRSLGNRSMAHTPARIKGAPKAVRLRPRGCLTDVGKGWPTARRLLALAGPFTCYALLLHLNVLCSQKAAPPWPVWRIRRPPWAAAKRSSSDRASRRARSTRYLRQRLRVECLASVAIRSASG
jgi:hypothetical protein